MAAGNAQTRADNTYTIAETLTEATKAMFELGVNAVPNDVFVAIKSMFDGIVGRLEALEGGGLPTGYTPLEYIQSSGTQYIDTGFTPDQNTRIVMDVQATAVKASSGFFGARTSTSANMFVFFMISATTIRSDFGTSKETVTVTSTLERFILDKNKETTTFGEYSAINTASDFVAPCALALLAVNTTGTVSNYISARLYSCEIYNNGSLIRDFVPCKNPDGAYGLYDKVNKQFYGNAGTGAFTGA